MQGVVAPVESPVLDQEEDCELEREGPDGREGGGGVEQLRKEKSACDRGMIEKTSIKWLRRMCEAQCAIVDRVSGLEDGSLYRVKDGTRCRAVNGGCVRQYNTSCRTNRPYVERK